MSKRVHDAVEVIEDNFVDPYDRYIRLLPKFGYYGRKAADEQAKNHRDFRVGASGAIPNLSTSLIEIYSRGSTRPNLSKDKVCAEQRLLGKFASLGVYDIEGILVAGPSDPTEIATVTDFPTPTLDPCPDRCLGKVLVGHDNMIVTTTGTNGPGRNIFRANLVGDLRVHYAEGNEDILMANVRPFEDMDARADRYLELKSKNKKGLHGSVLAVRALNEA
jgi:hypothetical protein